MPVESCVPIIPSANLEKSLRFWVHGLGFDTGSEMLEDGKLIGCMLRNRNLAFWLTRRVAHTIIPNTKRVRRIVRGPWRVVRRYL